MVVVIDGLCHGGMGEMTIVVAEMAGATSVLRAGRRHCHVAAATRVVDAGRSRGSGDEGHHVVHA
ncbi:putative formin-like protein 20 [Iris pallida]|uniref:Formin-like protein 20 n=1 Tax=Iris pallida TaxID=29817 RepID=A0AAX6EX02_IRIPA|nr:putative formin-like protein 20 [Iris pallida]KAJ6840983.1 putative formin-like protein 20 [Iris pallida]